jgi:Sigma-70 region 2
MGVQAAKGDMPGRYWAGDRCRVRGRAGPRPGGDEGAVARLFRDLQPLLLRYLRVTVAPGSAEDIAWDTWLDVVAGLEGFSSGEMQFRAWLFTIARHGPSMRPVRGSAGPVPSRWPAAAPRSG